MVSPHIMCAHLDYGLNSEYVCCWWMSLITFSVITHKCTLGTTTFLSKLQHKLTMITQSFVHLADYKGVS